MKNQGSRAGALLVSACLSACAAEGDVEDMEMEGLEELDEELLDEEDVLGAAEDEELEEDDALWEPDELQADRDPLEAGPNDGPLVGGSGGSFDEEHCPTGYIGVGTSVLRESNGQRIKHIGLICSPQIFVEFGLQTTAADQFVVATGFRSNRWPYYFREGGLKPKLQYDFEMLLESNTVHMCDPGFAVRGIRVRAGSRVDRVENLSCLNLNFTGGSLIYPEAVNVGGWGGTSQPTYCPGWPDAADGLHWREGWSLDAIGTLCRGT